VVATFQAFVSFYVYKNQQVSRFVLKSAHTIQLKNRK